MKLTICFSSKKEKRDRINPSQHFKQSPGSVNYILASVSRNTGILCETYFNTRDQETTI